MMMLHLSYVNQPE